MGKIIKVIKKVRIYVNYRIKKFIYRTVYGKYFKISSVIQRLNSADILDFKNFEINHLYYFGEIEKCILQECDLKYHFKSIQHYVKSNSTDSSETEWERFIVTDNSLNYFLEIADLKNGDQLYTKEQDLEIKMDEKSVLFVNMGLNPKLVLSNHDINAQITVVALPYKKFYQKVLSKKIIEFMHHNYYRLLEVEKCSESLFIIFIFVKKYSKVDVYYFS